jgi:hypothetical protein
MSRRTRRALLVALALLATPAAATTLALRERDASHDSVSAAARHHRTNEADVVVRAGGVHERRTAHHGTTPALLADATAGVGSSIGRAHVLAHRAAPAGRLPGSPRPRAPPVVV